MEDIQTSVEEETMAPKEEAVSNVISFPTPDAADTRKGHGRLGVEDYPDAEEFYIACSHLKAQDSCPENCGGKLYEISANEFMSIVGQSMAKAIHHQLQRLHCARCGLVTKADFPTERKQAKYDATFKAFGGTKILWGRTFLPSTAVAGFAKYSPTRCPPVGACRASGRLCSSHHQRIGKPYCDK